MFNINFPGDQQNIGNNFLYQDNPDLQQLKKLDRQKEVEYYHEDFQEILPFTEIERESRKNKHSPFQTRFLQNTSKKTLKPKGKIRQDNSEVFGGGSSKLNNEEIQVSAVKPSPIVFSNFRINQSKMMIQKGNYIISNNPNNLIKNIHKMQLMGSQFKTLKDKALIQINSTIETKKKSNSIVKRQSAIEESDQLQSVVAQKKIIFQKEQKQLLQKDDFFRVENDTRRIDKLKTEDLDTANNFAQKKALQPIECKSPQIIQQQPPNQLQKQAKLQIPKPQINQTQQITIQIAQVSQQDKTKMSNYFRHHLISLLFALSRKESYFDALKDNKKIKLIFPQYLIGECKWNLQQLKQRDELLNKIKKLLSTKGKYKYRERINFLNSSQLKSLNYDVKKKLTFAQANFNKSNKMIKEEEDEDDGSPQKKPKQQQGPIVTDINIWKKRNNIEPEGKVFIVKGGYADIKRGLEDRGWIENTDVYSLCFDFKWTCKVNDLDFNNLIEGQIVNHFDNNPSLTSKYGLARSLKSLIWYEDADIDTFYPRCYDLGDLTDFEDFIEDFKITKAESILINFLTKNKNTMLYNDENVEESQRLDVKEKYQEDDQPFDLTKSVKIRLAIQIVKRKLQDIIYIIEQIILNETYPVVSGEEWEIIKDDGDKKIIIKWQEMSQQLEKSDLPHLEDEQEFIRYYQPMISDLIQQLEKQEPQFNLNGYRNIWIIKPNFLSRGRGIKCFNSLDKILDHIIGKETQYVIQKYMENPMIIKSKKFDIRQWVLVQDFDPPRVWFFDECYIRFCAEEFDIDNLNNRFVHLTNNAIAKNSSNFRQGDIKGNMWSQEQFQEYLLSKTGQDIFQQKIQPQIKKIIILSIKSAQDQMKSRKNSMELFGYDFMIDEQYTPWLIEINSSPSMDYSTQITARLVPMVLEDSLKVTIDYSLAKPGTKKNIDTGKFKLIYKGDQKQLRQQVGVQSANFTSI